jgi:hypothetical protein
VYEAKLEAARKLFEDFAQSSMEYTPPHLCEIGEDDPQEAESCIPCGTVKSARALIAIERERADANELKHHRVHPVCKEMYARWVEERRKADEARDYIVKMAAGLSQLVNKIEDHSPTVDTLWLLNALDEAIPEPKGDTR